jgi:hypothetical protein
MRRPTRPFTVEFKSRRKPAQGSVLDESRGRLIDEPAPDEVPSRDVSEDASASASDDTPVGAANGVFNTVASHALSTAASLGDLASSAFTPQPPEPSPAAAPDEGPQGEGIVPSPVPASVSEDARPENRDGPLTEPAPKRHGAPARSPAHAEHAPDRDEQATETARPATMLEEQERGAKPSAPARVVTPVPEAPKPTRRRAEARMPAGERWKRRRLPKVCW